MTGLVRCSDDELDGAATGVVTVTLHDPDRLNALTVEMGERFSAAIAELSARAEIRAVVLTGAGRAFSAGGDLAFLEDRASDRPDHNAVEMRAFYRRFLCLRELPVPVIAAVNGHAIGAGMCLALACDVRVVAETAKLGVTFVQLGLHPGMGATHLLEAAAGPQVAAELLLTGDVIRGTEAAARGLAARAVPIDDVVPQALAIARRMASAAPVAVRTTLRSLRLRQDAGLERALWREADAQAQCYATDDLREGVRAVRDKRKPVFAGR